MSVGCRSCGCPLIFAEGELGRLSPIEAEQVEKGNARLIEREGRPPLVVYDKEDGQLALDDDGIRYINHFARCPEAKAWRKE